jgi:hypothetical protein
MRLLPTEPSTLTTVIGGEVGGAAGIALPTGKAAGVDVGHWVTLNHRVPGSSPGASTKKSLSVNLASISRSIKTVAAESVRT